MADLEPTEKGKRNYPYSRPRPGFYDGVPCTCTESCPDPCKDDCDCEACHRAYGDFLSLE